jgi:replicative DNA helicase
MEKPTEERPWLNIRQGYIEALAEIDGYRKGRLSSYITPWPKVNDAALEGLEWNSMVVIGGRPGSGKTLIKNQIIKEGFKLNAGQNIRVLEFQFEMMQKVTAKREFTSVLGKSYKELHLKGTDGVTDAQFERLKAHAKGQVGYPINVVEKKQTVNQINKSIRLYMEDHSTMEDTQVKDPSTGEISTVKKKMYKKTIITLDHSILVQREKNQQFLDMLYELGEMFTAIKREFPVIIIVLSQLGRQVENPDRAQEGSYANYILESDLFGGDALYQHADMVIGVNRPAKRFIKFFGPEKYIIDDDTVLVFHFLKVRNGDPRMSFFRAKFKTMEIAEMQTPGRKT